MSVGIHVNHVHINGTQLEMPAVVREAPKFTETVEDLMSGRRRIDAQFTGAGLPDRGIVYDFMLAWEFDSGYEVAVEFLEMLRVTPGPHTFTYWKRRVNRWTASSGQTVFYLPRPDAFAEGLSGHEADEWKAVVKIDGVAVDPSDVIYAASVTSGTVVPAGEVHISEASVVHELAGWRVALFKFGTAPGVGAVVTVEYFPLYQVDLVSLETTPFTGENVGREDKNLTFVEV